ncbi:MAG: SDR family oxidoreductase [Actinomycetales bacterium]|nr:SDR family oxidoreductase [Actinomycetales bacterium]
MRVAIVTGGSRGIGRAVVERLAAGGWGVLFTHSESPAEAAEVVAAVDAAGGTARALQLDVTDAGAPARLFDEAAQMGEVVALVNNAGVTGPLGALEGLTDDDLHRVVDVDLVAVARLCREAARRWTGDGARRDIVSISSIAARTGAAGEYVVYAAAKAGVEALSCGLARELGPRGVRVNVVAPGTTDTGIHARAGEPGRAARVGATLPLGRAARAEEVAGAVVWLLSGEAGFVSGSVLPVAGGA